MIYKYNGVKIAYRFVGNNSAVKTTIMLHGWGCDGNIFDDLTALMSDKRFLIVDFPPFGQSDVEPKNWNIFTYANMIVSLAHACKITSANVCGHSFGGRVAIIVSALYPEMFEKVILLDSAGLKPRRNLKYFLKIYFYKFAKSLGFVFSNAGSQDYRALSDNMKKVFVSVVSQHLDDYLPLIKQKTLIIFGKNDKETPIYMAKRLHKNIKNSSLTLIEGAGHFCFVDNLMTCYRLIDDFLGE